MGARVNSRVVFCGDTKPKILRGFVLVLDHDRDLPQKKHMLRALVNYDCAVHEIFKKMTEHSWKCLLGLVDEGGGGEMGTRWKIKCAW